MIREVLMVLEMFLAVVFLKGDDLHLIYNLHGGDLHYLQELFIYVKTS